MSEALDVKCLTENPNPTRPTTAMTESHPIPDRPGYTVVISHVEGPGNPLTFGDCEPPLLTFCDRYLTGYIRGDKNHNAITVPDLLACFPLWKFGRKQIRDEIIEALEITPEDLDYYLPDGKRLPEDWHNAINEVFARDHSRPTSWSEAERHFRALETLCRLARITCLLDTSRGYCQGHETLVFVAAMPGWQTLTGCPRKYHESQCRAAFDLYGAWAWGDVWQIDGVTDPDGRAVTEQTYGSEFFPPGTEFFGDDHAATGLYEIAQEIADAHRDWLAAEETASQDAACRDIETVPDAAFDRWFGGLATLATS